MSYINKHDCKKTNSESEEYIKLEELKVKIKKYVIYKKNNYGGDIF